MSVQERARYERYIPPRTRDVRIFWLMLAGTLATAFGMGVFAARMPESLGMIWAMAVPVVAMMVSTQSCTTCTDSDDFPNRARRTSMAACCTRSRRTWDRWRSQFRRYMRLSGSGALPAEPKLLKP